VLCAPQCGPGWSRVRKRIVEYFGTKVTVSGDIKFCVLLSKRINTIILGPVNLQASSHTVGFAGSVVTPLPQTQCCPVFSRLAFSYRKTYSKVRHPRFETDDKFS